MKAAAARIESLVLNISPFSEINYERTYSVPSLILLFFTFSGIGFIWEVFLHIIEDGMIINRGVLLGPWLPIYGTGGVLILVLLKRWRSHPFQMLGLIISLCGIMEFGTSIALEQLFGVQWWDYSDMLFNIQGRICLEGLIIFGLGGLAIVYIGAPKLDDLFRRLSVKASLMITSILLALFIMDAFRSFLTPNTGFGITS